MQQPVGLELPGDPLLQVVVRLDSQGPGGRQGGAVLRAARLAELPEQGAQLGVQPGLALDPAGEGQEVAVDQGHVGASGLHGLGPPEQEDRREITGQGDRMGWQPFEQGPGDEVGSPECGEPPRLRCVLQGAHGQQQQQEP